MVRCLTSSSSEDSDSGPPPARPVAKKKPKRHSTPYDPLATSESEDESPQRPMVRKKTPAAAAPAAQAEKKQKPSNSDSEDEPLPAPPAREEAQEPIDLTAPADRTASAFDCSSSEPNNLQLLAAEPLVKMGFPVEEVAPALWFAGGNIPRATALLCLGVSPMSQPALEIRDSVRLSGKIHNLKVNYYDNAISRDLSNTLLRLLTAPISDGGGGLGLPAPRGGVRLSYYVGDPDIDPSWRPWSGPGASEGDSILGLIGYKLSLGLGYCTCKSWQYTPCWKKKYQGFRCKHMKALFPEE